MKSIYVAGPMTNMPDGNFPNFDRVTQALRAQGWSVISPADMDREKGFDPTGKGVYTEDMVDDQFMACTREADIKAVEKCDAIFFLVGWEMSTGGFAEWAYARWAKKEMYYESTL